MKKGKCVRRDDFVHVDTDPARRDGTNRCDHSLADYPYKTLTYHDRQELQASQDPLWAFSQDFSGLLPHFG